MLHRDHTFSVVDEFGLIAREHRSFNLVPTLERTSATSVISPESTGVRLAKEGALSCGQKGMINYPERPSAGVGQDR
jgi:hypothetical protein